MEQKIWFCNSAKHRTLGIHLIVYILKGVYLPLKGIPDSLFTRSDVLGQQFWPLCVCVKVIVNTGKVMYQTLDITSITPQHITYRQHIIENTLCYSKYDTHLELCYRNVCMCEKSIKLIPFS